MAIESRIDNRGLTIYYNRFGIDGSVYFIHNGGYDTSCGLVDINIQSKMSPDAFRRSTLVRQIEQFGSGIHYHSTIPSYNVYGNRTISTDYGTTSNRSIVNQQPNALPQDQFY